MNMVNGIVLVEIFLVSFFLICSILICELLTRKLSIKPSISRKIIHVFGACSIAASSFFLDYKIFLFVAPVFIPILIFARTNKFQSLSDRSDKSFGEILFPLGVFIAALVSPSGLTFAAAMFVLGISDTIAFFVGINIKSLKIFFNKTIAGSSAFFVFTLIILLFFIDFKTAAIIALLSTITELMSPRGSDNVTIPLAISVIFAINL